MNRCIRESGGRTLISVIPQRVLHINYGIFILFCFLIWTPYLAYMFIRYTEHLCKNLSKPQDAGYYLTEFFMFHILSSSDSFLVPVEKPLLQEIVAILFGINSVSCCRRGPDLILRKKIIQYVN